MYLFNLNDSFLKYNESCLFDRTQTIKQHPKIYFHRKIGKSNNLNFKDVCLKRAFELKNISDSNNKSLCLFWSGGIDSTVAFFSLLDVGVKNLKIAFTKESINEYPFCYDKYVKYLNKVIFHPEKTSIFVKENVENCLFVTGEIGDQLFGNNLFAKINPITLNKNWQHIVNKKIIEETERFVFSCPVEIKTVKEFLWWINYALRYQYVSYKIPLAIKDLYLDKNLFNFFDSDDWNDWSVSTDMEYKFYGTNIKNYKMIAKEFIFSFTKDEDYKNNKLKEQYVRLYDPQFVFKKINIKGEKS